MPVVTPTPTDPTIALPAPDVPEDFASELRANINASKDAVDAKAMLNGANIEALHSALGFGALSGGATTVGTGLSVNVASLSALVGTKVAYSGSQVVGGLEDNQINYVFLRQDATWTIPAGGSSTTPSSGDGHGAALLWAKVTTVAGGVTAVDETVRVDFVDAVAATIDALKASLNLSDLDDLTTAQQNLSLEPGVDVQAYSAVLAALASVMSSTATAAAQRAALSAAASGSNSDITALTGLTNAITVITGSGSPEGSVTATVGKLYVDTGTGLLYTKQSGSGNTGWAVPVGSVFTTRQTNSGGPVAYPLNGTNLIFCDASGGAISHALPAASGILGTIKIFKIDATANTVTFTAAGGDTILGTAVLTTQGQSITLDSDGGTLWGVNAG